MGDGLSYIFLPFTLLSVVLILAWTFDVEFDDKNPQRLKDKERERDELYDNPDGK